jgi:hypothetical protein
MNFQENKKQLAICACKNCDRIGKNRLKVIYFNKEGWFCEICTSVLIKEGLVIAKQL